MSNFVCTQNMATTRQNSPHRVVEKVLGLIRRPEGLTRSIHV